MAGVIGVTTMVALAAAPSGASAASAAGGSEFKPAGLSAVTALGSIDVRALAARAARATAIPVTAAGSATDAARMELDRSRSEAKSPSTSAEAAVVGTPSNTPVVDAPGRVRAYDGLSAADSRLADNGNQFTNEPPDGAICEGQGVAVELVNSAVQFFTSTGSVITAPLSANQFYGLPPSIDRQHDPIIFPGPSLGDPRCLYDAGSGRMMILFWGTGQDRKTGAFTGQNTYFLAVQATSDPLGSYYGYRLDVDKAGSVGCKLACLADFPMLGSDANSVTISYNSFGATSSGGFQYNQDRLIVLSKKRLTSGRVGPAAFFRVANVGGLQSYTLQPAANPPGGGYDVRQRGTQWLLESPPTRQGTKQLGLAAIVNTSAIDSNPDALRVKTASIRGELAHAIPTQQGVRQRKGPRPLGAHLKEFYGVPNEPLPKLDAGFDKASSVQLADGKLWTAINTRVEGGAIPRAGQLLTSVVPDFTAGGDITGRVAAQRYIAVANGSLLYGDIAVAADGRHAAMVGSLVSPDRYPSAVTADVNVSTLGVDQLNVYLAGKNPEDGFSCYAAFGGGPCRWGDYSEINVGTDGDFYMMTEYVTPRLRTFFANWGTAIGRMMP